MPLRCHPLGFALGLALVVPTLVDQDLPLSAESASLQPVADTGLHELSPDNNMGHHTHMPAGTTAKKTRTRALLRFDLRGTDGIPSTSTITSARLRLHVTLIPDGGVAATYALHRVLADWSEGDKKGNTGSRAANGETTWKSRGHPDLPWGEPGLKPGVDYSVAPSTSVPISAEGEVIFPSTDRLVADVQSWLHEPDTNFGWLLLSQDEITPQTAKRFGSRESGGTAPNLEVEFFRSDREPLVITSISVVQDEVTLWWTGGAPPYQVKLRTDLTHGEWRELGDLTNENTATHRMISKQSFFRIDDGNPP